MLRKIGIIAVLSLMALALAAVPALAVDPISITRSGGLHFVGTPTVTADKSGDTATLTADAEVAGAGTTATATLTADATVVAGCINPGSKDQQPSGLQETTTPVVGTETINTRQGRGTFSVDATASIPEDFSCPRPMRETLVSATFTDVTLTVTSQTGTTTAFFGTIDP
jgi:hypothetical protein